ncbi:MAG: HAD family hydrolase [Rhodobacteraceae bacterium]|nr:HAD family hydrolase [Paracoccaceae bacterium]
MNEITGIVFDKDGTLYDFQKTWGAVCAQQIEVEAAGDLGLKKRLAEVLGYDLKTDLLTPDSICVSEPTGFIAQKVAHVLPNSDVEALILRMDAMASTAPQVEVLPLRQFIAQLKKRGLRLGVATNDSEAPARAHLRSSQIETYFEFIAGYDSGFGGKPAPGQLNAFLAQTGLVAGQVAMIGDSLHDLHAGRAAGMVTVGVLTGLASRDDLRGAADIVLDDISELPHWLDNRTAAV